MQLYYARAPARIYALQLNIEEHLTRKVNITQKVDGIDRYRVFP